MFSLLFHMHTNNFQHSWKWSVINPYHYVNVYILCIYAGVDGLDLVLKSRQHSLNLPLGVERMRKDGFSMGSRGKDSRKKTKNDTG